MKVLKVLDKAIKTLDSNRKNKIINDVFREDLLPIYQEKDLAKKNITSENYILSELKKVTSDEKLLNELMKYENDVKIEYYCNSGMIKSIDGVEKRDYVEIKAVELESIKSMNKLEE